MKSLVLLAVVVAGLLLLTIPARLAPRAQFRYRAGKAVLSPAELAFYRRLRRLLEPRALVLANYTDFTIVDPESAKPIACRPFGLQSLAQPSGRDC